MLKVTKVQPIATHRDYTRKDRGNFQEIYCKARENCGILCAQAGDYKAAEEALKNYHGSLAKSQEDSIVLMGHIGIDFRSNLSKSTGGRPATDKRRKTNGKLNENIRITRIRQGTRGRNLRRTLDGR